MRLWKCWTYGIYLLTNNSLLVLLNTSSLLLSFVKMSFCIYTWYLMKSGFIDECLSIAPLVTSIQPVFEHINGCGIHNFIWQLVPRCDGALVEKCWSSHCSTSLYSNFALVTSQTVYNVATFKKTHVCQFSPRQSSLCNREDHYIFMLWLLLSSFFFLA